MNNAKILAALRTLKRRVNKRWWQFWVPHPAPYAGICYNSSLGTCDLRPAFEAWPKYSGNLTYPVMVPSKSHTPKHQFMSAQITHRLWDRSTEYGALRHELLDFLITYYEERCESNTTSPA